MAEEILKVFILEDLETDLQLAKRQVLKYNPKCTFTTANSRSSFNEKISWLQPDIVISDYDLPDFNGLEALIYIKEHMPDVPFIFLTGTLNNDEKVARVILQGADGFVIKQNIKTLPSVLAEVIATNNHRIAMAREKAEKNRQRKLLLNKLSAHAKTIKSNDLKVDILETVEQLQSLL